jgi:hypothetical protein
VVKAFLRELRLQCAGESVVRTWSNDLSLVYAFVSILDLFSSASLPVLVTVFVSLSLSLSLCLCFVSVFVVTFVFIFVLVLVMVFVCVSVLALYLSWSLSWYMSMSLFFVCLYTTTEHVSSFDHMPCKFAICFVLCCRCSCWFSLIMLVLVLSYLVFVGMEVKWFDARESLSSTLEDKYACPSQTNTQA